jgi:hypothetical protein
MTQQALETPRETTTTTWGVLPWREEMSQEELLAVWMQQSEGKPKNTTKVVQ